MARKRKLPEGLWERNGTYYARFRGGGRLVRKRLSSDFDAACELLRDMRARADKADFNLIDNDYQWSELKAEFLRWVKQTKRRPHEYEADLNRFEAYCTVRSIRQIDHQFVFGFRTWRLGQTIGKKRNRRRSWYGPSRRGQSTKRLARCKTCSIAALNGSESVIIPSPI